MGYLMDCRYGQFKKTQILILKTPNMKELKLYSEIIDVELTNELGVNKVSKWLPFIGKNYKNAPEKVLLGYFGQTVPVFSE